MTDLSHWERECTSRPLITTVASSASEPACYQLCKVKPRLVIAIHSGFPRVPLYVLSCSWVLRLAWILPVLYARIRKLRCEMRLYFSYGVFFFVVYGRWCCVVAQDVKLIIFIPCVLSKVLSLVIFLKEILNTI